MFIWKCHSDCQDMTGCMLSACEAVCHTFHRPQQEWHNHYVLFTYFWMYLYMNRFIFKAQKETVESLSDITLYCRLVSPGKLFVILLEAQVEIKTSLHILLSHNRPDYNPSNIWTVKSVKLRTLRLLLIRHTLITRSERWQLYETHFFYCRMMIQMSPCEKSNRPMCCGFKINKKRCWNRF